MSPTIWRTSVFTLLFLSLSFTRVYSQCTLTATLQGNHLSCTGGDLSLTGNNTFTRIVWQKDGTDLSTVYATSGYQGVTVAGGNDIGDAPNQLYNPASIWLDAAGNMYICDDYNNRIQKWAPGATTGITVAGGNGYGSGAGQFALPVAVFVDASGNIYVADMENDRVQLWTPGATTGVTVAGGNGRGSAANQLAGPSAVFVDAAGNVYVSDYSNERVQKWAPGATTGVTVAGGNGFGSNASQLADPEGIWVDDAGNLYISDLMNHRIQKYAPGATSGTTVISAPAGELFYPAGLFVDAAGNIYVGEGVNLEVQKWAPGASTYTIVAGGNGYGSGPNQITNAAGIYVDPAGAVYVADNFNNRVQKFTLQYVIDPTYTATAAGSYTATVTDINGCTATTDALVIGATLVPAVTIATPAAAVCAGSPATFTASVIDGGVNPVYTWQINGTNVSGPGGLSFTSTTLQDGDQIDLLLTSDAACPSTGTSNIIQVSVVPAPTITIIEPAAPVCAGAPVTLTTTTTNEGSTPAWVWQINGNTMSTAGPTYTDNNPIDGSVITCTLTGSPSCPSVQSNSLVLAVSPPPSIAPGQVFSSTLAQPVVLTPAITGDIVNYAWTPSEGLSDPGIGNPVASPAHTTVYTLMVTAANGCTASGDITVKVYTQLKIPSAFTPNGDGKNDIFYVMGGSEGTTISEFAVFNRWGQALFRQHDVPSGDPAFGWNGAINGAPAPAGVYVYVVKLSFSDGSPQVLKGTVTLIR